MKKRIFYIVAAVTVGLAAAGCAFYFWHNHIIEQQRERQFAAIEQLLNRKNPREALAAVLALRQQSAGGLDAASLARLQRLEFQACVGLRDLPRLLVFYRKTPELFHNEETSSLLVARTLLSIHDVSGLESLRSSWRGREKQPEAWLCFDADVLLSQRKPDDARALLEGTQFSGPQDCSRLLRLAILNARKPEEAVRYFNAAYQADPKNPDLRSFRGQILEAAGQTALARVEYVAALAAAPENPLLRDQLADFYLRVQDYPKAVQTFADALQSNPFDFMRVKAGFWAKVALPLPAEKPGTPGEAGRLSPLGDYLLKLPSGTFWDESGFERLRDTRIFTATRPEVFWLRLLQTLKDGHEREALASLSGDPFRHQSPQPELESALLILLKNRLRGQRPLLGDFDRTYAARHQFFDSLVAWSEGRPEGETEAFAASPYAFAGACLAAGWCEAALTLAPTDRPLDDAPEWFVYGMAQALRQNRGNQAALAFVNLQRPSVLMQLEQGELELAEGQAAAGEAALAKVASQDSDAGFRAAWLLATSAMERKDFAAARDAVTRQPRLARDVTGRELIARIALFEGRKAEATALYEKLAGESMEAKAFLARQAYTDKRWEDARRWTNQLVEQFPDNPQFRENLRLIDQAAR